MTFPVIANKTDVIETRIVHLIHQRLQVSKRTQNKTDWMVKSSQKEDGANLVKNVKTKYKNTPYLRLSPSTKYACSNSRILMCINWGDQCHQPTCRWSVCFPIFFSTTLLRIPLRKKRTSIQVLEKIIRLAVKRNKQWKFGLLGACDFKKDQGYAGTAAAKLRSYQGRTRLYASTCCSGCGEWMNGGNSSERHTVDQRC